MIVDDVGDDIVFCEEIRKEKKIRNNKGKNVHTAHIHVRVHKGP